MKKSYLYPGNVGLIGRKDFTDLRDTTMRTFFEVCPRDYIKFYNKTEHHLFLMDGSEILFRDLKDLAGFGSLDLGWWYIDEAEQVEHSIFTYLKGRLSKKGVGKPCGWITTNPPNEDHWIHKEFEESNHPDYFTIHASTYENRENLPKFYIEDLERLPPSWRKKYLEGQYGFTPDGTPYYSGYTPFMHKTSLTWNPALPLDCGWDSGKRHPAFVVTQVEGGRWRILKELMGTDITIDNFVEFHVKPFLNRYFPNANCRHYGGPEFLQVNDKSDFTSYQILQSKGIQLNIKHSEYSLRKEIIEKLLNCCPGGVPNLQVDNSCRIINDGFLGGYRYPKRKPDQAFGVKFEIPFKDGFYEHPINAIEYVAIHLFAPIDRKPHKPEKRRRQDQSRDNI